MSLKLGLPSEVKLLIGVLGIYICYLSYGICQEGIYKFRSETGEKFTATLFFLLIQCSGNTLIAAIEILLFGRSETPPPLMTYSYVGFGYISAMLSSNEALKYVSYPTQALGKSSKMIPVMLFGFLLHGKRYSRYETAAVLLITGGIYMFQSKKDGGNDSIYGLALLFISLLLDGWIGPEQDRLQKKHRLNTQELMFYINIWAIALLLVLSAASGQAVEGYMFCYKNPDIWYYLLTASITSAVGQNFIFFTLSNFNSLTVATITTTRKFFTVLVSVLWFGHELREQQWLGVGLVFVGLLLELVNKYNKKEKTEEKKA